MTERKQRYYVEQGDRRPCYYIIDRERDNEEHDSSGVVAETGEAGSGRQARIMCAALNAAEEAKNGKA